MNRAGMLLIRINIQSLQSSFYQRHLSKSTTCIRTMDILSKTFLQCFDIFAQPVYKWGCYIRVQTNFSTHFQIWNLKSWQPINLKCFIDLHLTNLIIICVSWNTYLNPERGLIAYNFSPVWVIGKIQNVHILILCD